MALTESSPPTLDEEPSSEEMALPPLPSDGEPNAALADAAFAAVDIPIGDIPSGAFPPGELSPGELPAGESSSGDLPAGELPAGEPAEKPQVARWYAVQVASSCEKKVKATLEQRAITLGVSNRILDIEIPQTPGVKLKKDGTRQSIEEKVFPGYVLVRMILDEDTMMAVRSTPNVINFVGQEERRATGKTRGHIKPRPLSRTEVERIFRRATEKKAVVKVDLSEGDQILVTGGPFKDFQGEVIEVSAERSKLKALLSIFGRETPVELEFSQVSKQN
ncbi:MAG: transcription termination/antitermination protein NusG [Cyanobacteriota bacterium]|nr:transcription termination/antitermination protein NusG [Cyanobacteriota bacterium]